MSGAEGRASQFVLTGHMKVREWISRVFWCCWQQLYVPNSARVPVLTVLCVPCPALQMWSTHLAAAPQQAADRGHPQGPPCAPAALPAPSSRVAQP